MTADVADIPGLAIEHELGRGASSVVYRARKGSRPCAVKLARRGGRSSRWFRREAAALARVRHPGVPAVLEVGELAGSPYLVMELVEGESLAARLRRAPLRGAEVLRLARELARIVEAVHAEGLVHRDIKPGNIILDPQGRARLVDFGLVTPLYRVVGDLELAGTRSYAAPEQMHAPQLVDARSDLFSVGRVLSDCIGRMSDPPSGLDAVIDRLVSEDMDARYPSAAALEADLERIEHGDRPAVVTSGGIAVTSREPLPLVGREKTMRSLVEAWSAASSGRGRVVLIEGPPGAGKTRITTALAEHVARQASAIRIAATGGSPVPLAVVRQLVDALLVALHERLGDGLAGRVRGLAEGPTAATVATLSPRLAELLGNPDAPPNLEPEAFVEATATLLLDLVRDSGPAMCTIDDLQWVDPVSREVLVRVALGTEDAPLLFVAAARADARSLPNVQRFARALGRERLSVVDLAALRPADIEALCTAYIGARDADAGLVERVTALSDGTPMGALEVLAALVDNGALEPHWGAWRFDVARAEQIELPHGLSQVLERRLAQLPVATRRVLEIAALMGVWLSIDRVARVAEVQPLDLQIALREGGQAGVLDLRGGTPRFVHDTVREALLRPLGDAGRVALHQKIALVLVEETDRDRDAIFAAAEHFLEGDPMATPERAYRAMLGAAHQATASLDHEVALRFFEAAERCAVAGGIRVDRDLHRGLAESRIRVGALDESLPALERVLQDAPTKLERAEILARMAWVHQMRADPDLAWRRLGEAFMVLDERLPTEDPRAVLGTATHLATSAVKRRFARAPDADTRARLGLLCELHYQNARLGVEYERPFRTLQSALAVLRHGERLGPSAHLATAHAQYGVFMTVLGRRGVGRRHLEQARAMAEAVRDPVAQAVTHQLDTMVAMWTSDTDRGMELARDYLDRFGHWLEVTEYCLMVASALVIESARGRPDHGLAWLERALDRVRRHGRIPAVVPQLVIYMLQETLAALGREDEVSRYLPDLETTDERPKSFFRVGSWGAKAQRLLHTGRLGEEFEALVREFEAEGYDPRRVHLVVAHYYLVVAHVRSMQCRDAPEPLRARRLAAFDAALSDLRKSARIDLNVAHVRLLEGERALLVGDEKSARKSFAEARRLGEEQTAPWVLGSVALAEARMLAQKGRMEAARDEARVAAMLAYSHGAVPRARAIMEEFQLRREDIGPAEPPSASASEPSSWSSRRTQLRSLASVVRVGAGAAGLEAQAEAVLDEILRVMEAERGALLFERDTVEPTRVLMGRMRGSSGWVGMDRSYTAILKRVCDSGREMSTGSQESSAGGSSRVDAHRMIALPLWLQQDVVGALLLERAESQPAFGPEDAQLVATLAPQVPLALELARLLEERDRLGETLRHAQKMEAVGQLASGVAHDFNNVLAAISASLDVLGDEPRLAPEQANALSIVRDSVHRAADLTRHLLAFSRRQVLDLVPVDVSAVVQGLRPMLQRLLGERITVDVACDEGVCPVKTDRTSLEQAVINLVVNARDAMPHGGEIRIHVEEITVDETGLVLGASRTGPHVRIEVTDTGTGMPPEIAEKVFEPFFTTKPVGSGTGLGLASVYGFVKQCGGHIDVSSTVGVGSTFIILLPAAADAPAAAALEQPARPVAPPPRRRAPGSHPGRILVVDDEPLVLRTTGKALERAGFEVIFATNGAEALRIVQDGSDVDLVVTDVQMPEMDGPAFVRRLGEIGVRIPVLLVSGYPDEELAGASILGAGVEFLQKPFTLREIGDRVRRMLDA